LETDVKNKLAAAFVAAISFIISSTAFADTVYTNPINMGAGDAGSFSQTDQHYGFD
jgi:hypothetical protein